MAAGHRRRRAPSAPGARPTCQIWLHTQNLPSPHHQLPLYPHLTLSYFYWSRRLLVLRDVEPWDMLLLSRWWVGEEVGGGGAALLLWVDGRWGLSEVCVTVRGSAATRSCGSEVELQLVLEKCLWETKCVLDLCPTTVAPLWQAVVWEGLAHAQTVWTVQCKHCVFYRSGDKKLMRKHAMFSHGVLPLLERSSHETPGTPFCMAGLWWDSCKFTFVRLAPAQISK